jgi:hypothetical protein
VADAEGGSRTNNGWRILMGTTVTLSLISHTNVGKTTLARTLLRRDVGDVLDQAHITDVNEAYVLIEKDDDQLRLWDTPGFGDTARLMRRLKKEKEPIVWFLKQQWDRLADRPLWCSQQGVINIKEEADVVLYLAGAAEDPEDTGYTPLELDLLTWIGRPVIVLLNQVVNAGLFDGESNVESTVESRVESRVESSAEMSSVTSSSVEARWRSFLEPWKIVKDVMTLDAFTRSWTEESAVLERIISVLHGDKRRAMGVLTEAWNQRNLAVFRSSCSLISRYITRAALDRETAESTSSAGSGERSAVRLLADTLKFTAIDRKRAMEALGRKLDNATQQLMEAMIREHSLAGSSAVQIEKHIHEFQIRGRMPLNERSGAVAGAILSGALGGLIADISIGFLSFGGGMVAGGILGALGGSALARGYRLVGGVKEPSVSWSPQFLDRLVQQVLLRYLAVAHFGRGRGDYRDPESQARRIAMVEDKMRKHRLELKKIWLLADSSDSNARDRLTNDLERVIDTILRSILKQAYPGASTLLC